MSEITHKCKDCNLEFFYDPKFHECADPLLITPTTTWVEECIAKVYGPSPRRR